jgi:hypothetical protein
MVLFLVVLLVVAVLSWLVRRQRHTDAQVRDQQVRLRAQREQYAAERQLQATAQQAFRQLLEDARSANQRGERML